MSGSGDPTVVTVEQVKAVLTTDLSDEALEDVIAREEAYLRKHIGQLTGERDQTCYILDADLDMPLYLMRPTDEVTVVDNDVAIDEADIRLLDSGVLVERADAAWDGPVVVLTYTPNDELLVEQAIIDLVSLSVTNSPYESERIGEYSYSRGTGAGARNPATMRQNIVNGLKPLYGTRTLRMKSSVRTERVGYTT